jgi:hypothetical protein
MALFWNLERSERFADLCYMDLETVWGSVEIRFRAIPLRFRAIPAISMASAVA